MRKGRPYPWKSIRSRRVCFSVANFYTLSDSRGTYNVIIAARQRTSVDEIDVEIWCGDQYLEGRSMLPDQAAERCAQAVEGLPDAERVRQIMESDFSSLPASTKCDFWKLKHHKNPRLCEHTQHVLAELFTIQDLRELCDALQSFLEGREAPPIPGEGPGLLPRLMFRVPVLFEGDRGSGKTYEAHAFARERNLPLIEVAGHEGVEAMDLLGSYVPVADRSLVWKDGPVSQAFRQAAKGQPTVLLIDELLRIPTRQQSVLLTALSPIDGCYRLRTGRIVNVEDGVGEEEVLACKIEHLAVIATTNVGAEYALDDLDPAIAERWVILRKDTTEEGLREVLGKVVADKGFSSELVGQLVRFFVKMRELRNVEQVARMPTTRTLVRAVELAEREEEVSTMLLHQALLWVGRDMDGSPIMEQLETVQRAVTVAFARKGGKA